jgi:ferredoxin-NADP reductase
MDTNNRGGPPGFIRAISNTEIAYPEYSGNRLYQSLGNLINFPAIGMVIPDFETGNVLHITGIAEILMGEKANALIPRTNVVIKIKLVDTRLIRQGLSFRGKAGEPSPYNPPVKLLATEGNLGANFGSQPEGTATLIDKDDITPTITRYRFRASHPVKYRPGQWVALDFSEELNMGYSHMRDDDPTSLNDDFVRTFTVSSHPDELPENEFEIVARLHGPVTEFLKKQRTASRNTLEVKLRGFGGDFKMAASAQQEVLPFIAGGVGITPLMGQLKELDLSKLRLIWITKAEDTDLVLDTFKRYPGLAESTTLFFTGKKGPRGDSSKLDTIRNSGATVIIGRPADANELIKAAPKAEIWYLCAGKALRKQLLEWLAGKKVEFENFDY